jgi:S-methylmethionine-dependent homocysteine/selenocysteine methylase
MDFKDRLSRGPLVLLDGATGTELTRRGVDTGLPLWSANALVDPGGAEVLLQIHSDYVAAGAEIITANTFRTHARALAHAGQAGNALQLTRRAVSIARAAVNAAQAPHGCWVAGSISTLEDCYRPDLVPPEAECRTEHAERVHHLLACGIDLFLIETMNTIREAAVAARLAVITGVPVVVSFVCDSSGRLLSGESLADAARELLPLGVVSLGANCVPADVLTRSLEQLRSACGNAYPLIAYGNVGYADDRTGWVNTDAVDAAAYAAYAASWPVRIVGGCCGTTPAHIAELRRRLQDQPAPSARHDESD